MSFDTTQSDTAVLLTLMKFNLVVYDIAESDQFILYSLWFTYSLSMILYNSGCSTGESNSTWAELGNTVGGSPIYKILRDKNIILNFLLKLNFKPFNSTYKLSTSETYIKLDSLWFA